MSSIESPTKIKLISDALVMLGEKPASSLSENRYGVTVGSNLFERLYEAELQANRWRFAVTKAGLSRLVAAPLNEWQNAFQLPSDMLLPIGVYPKCDYEIYGDHLYAQATEIELDYLFKPQITELPAYFTLLLTFALARVMAKPITESDTTASKWEREYIAQRARAMFADAQGRPNRPITDNRYVQVRR